MSADTPMSDIVRLEGVTVDFNAQGDTRPLVLDDISLQCREGEFLVLIGKSGCGKTTVLNLLAGLLEPTDGSVTVLGRAPRDVRRSIGYMFARDALMPWRTARRNVEFCLELDGVAKGTRRATADRLLDSLKLHDVGDKYPWQLSQGMCQRVALARTWASNPRLILMDEPFSALDAMTRDHARVEFLRIWEANRTSVVFVTHDLQEALLMADRVILLGQGFIQREIKVPFPRPRRLGVLTRESAFLELEAELAAALE